MAYTPKQIELQDRLFKVLLAFSAEWDVTADDIIAVVGNVRTHLIREARKDAKRKRS